MLPAAAERPLISVAEAADLAGVSRSVGYSWVRAGCMPGAVHLGGRWYVRSAPLLAWLNGQEPANGAERAATTDHSSPGPRQRAT